ncbi:MAG TPA: pentapeptide repeat-containing protein [Lactobacillus sp.]|nr:pentapeptide repeat-containing protein [Lactobacillus sp.]
MSEQTEVVEQTLSLDDVEPDQKYVRCHFTVSNEPIRIVDVTFDHCTFDQTNFDNADFSSVTWTHSQFLNATWRQSSWFHCKLKSLQLAGSDFSEAVMKDTTFDACKLTYANFSEMRVESGQFLNCDLLESAFQAIRVKKTLSFAGSRLTGADFVETRLKGVDWHEADFETLSMSAQLASGLIVSQYQAAQLI